MATICSKYPNLFSINSHQVKQASPKEQQLEEVKKHVRNWRFCEILSPKVESVQIAWDETQWEEVGNGTLRRAAKSSSFEVLTTSKNSSWSVLAYLKDTKNDDKQTSVEGIGNVVHLCRWWKLFDE